MESNDERPIPAEDQALAAVLLSSKELILELWKAQIQLEIESSRHQTSRALEDHMPHLIEAMAHTMRVGIVRGSTSEQKEFSKVHARQRSALLDYTLEEVLEEYRIAREIIVGQLNKDSLLSPRAQCLVNRIIDRAIVDAGTEFTRFKNEENEQANVRLDDARVKAETAQATAESAQDRAEIASQTKSDFLANISHEIRTPLGAILGFTELMRDPNLSYDDRSRFADIVNRNGRQLSTLINDILDISKVEAGRLDVEKISVSLASVVAEVTTLLRITASGKGLDLNVNAWRDIPIAVLSDPTRLTQILTNMIGNAIKFTSSGSVTVSLERTEEPDQFRFVVEDTGIGITEKQQRELFQSFAQGDNSTTRKFGGSGLGLFLSKKLSRAVGGDLFLKSSRAGEGSVFVATFRAESVIDQKAIMAQLSAKLETAPLLSGVRILLAEDSPDNQVLVSRILQKEGAIVEFASNGQEALEIALRAENDVVLMDIQMPILDGYAATRKLREQGYLGPILALTANAMAEEKMRAVSAGCNAHIAKPIIRAELITTITRFVTPAR